MWAMLLLVFVVGFVATGTLTFLVRSWVRRFGIVDRPNERSSHSVPTARAGGLSIVLTLAFTSPFLLPWNGRLVLCLVCVGAVAIVSLIDDVRSLSFKVRLATQTLAAGVLIAYLDLTVRSIDLLSVDWRVPHWLGLLLATLFVVGYSNFFNFMDGINGLAAGQAVIVGGALSLLSAHANCGPIATFAALVAGAAAGFLPHNFPRAAIFMGDVGSVTLGFTLAVLSLAVHTKGDVSWVAILLVHAVFLFDCLFTLLKRWWRGENLTRPHREHNYQLLVRGGWSHSRTTLTLCLLSVETCAAGLIYAWWGESARWLSVIVTAVTLFAFAAVSHRFVGVVARHGDEAKESAVRV